MISMFNRCYSLIKLNLYNFDTSNVIDMSYMLCDCPLLKEIKLKNLDTNNVTDMSFMFYNYKFLKEINLTNLNTNNEINMSRILDGCTEELKTNIKKQNTI